MLTIQGVLAVAALLVAVATWLRARRAVRRLEQLTESYWELRYEYGELRARLLRLDAPAEVESPEPVSQPGTAFVPLSSLKR